MRDGLVSVVVPVYKTEKYLDRCINSIVNQTYRNLEILLIDDGSPDNCPEMCDAWARKDNRIRVIHKINEGLGVTRNTGIESANGEYICFVDSDDYIDVNTIEHAYWLCKRESADIALFGFVIANNMGEVIAREIPRPVKNLYFGKEVQSFFLADLVGTDPKTGNVTNLYMSACVCLFSVEMINRANWRFASERDIIAEDVYSLLGLYRFVNKVVILNEELYYYCENLESLTHTYRFDRFDNIKVFYIKCIQLCHDCKYPLEVEYRCAEPFLSFTIAAMKQEAAYYSNKAEAIKRIRVIVDDELLQQVLGERRKDNTNIKKKILYWAMRHKCYRLCYILLVLQNTVKK